MKVVALLPLALAASALVIPDAEIVEALTKQQHNRKSHPIWDNARDPKHFWEEVENRFDQATKFTQHKINKVINNVHDTAAKYSDDYQSAFAAQAWMDSANHYHGFPGDGDGDGDDDDGPPEDWPGRRHHPHHGPPEEPPEDAPPEDGPPEDGPPEDEPERPPRGPPHRRPHCPHRGPPDDDEPPHRGRPPFGRPPPPDGPPPPPHCPTRGPPPPHHCPHRGPPHHHPPPPPHCPCHPPHHRFPHHPHIPHHFNATIYQIITGNNFTTKLAKAINEYPDLVSLLNTTNATHTLFAPLDIAFDRMPEGAPKAPKDLLKKILTYHVSPELYDTYRILGSRTIPSALQAPFIGNRSQRISTQLGLFGLNLNFYAHVIAADFYGTNGVIHAIDNLLFPPPQAIDVISLLPTFFSTFELGLVQTGLFDAFRNTSLHEGGTLFLPPNSAFALLGPLINGFLFSPFGLKYLRALLLYHAVPDITLYSDAIYKAGNSSADAQHFPFDFFHIELPTGLANHTLSVNVGRFGRLVDIKVNGFVDCIVLDGIVADGVVHVVPLLLIPPREAGAPADAVTADMSLEEFKARLEPYVEKDDIDHQLDSYEQYIEMELK